MTNLILLTSSDPNPWKIFAGFVILAVACVIVYMNFKKSNNSEKEMNDFLNSIQDNIKAAIVAAIDKFDFNDINKSLTELTDTFINSLYDSMWDLVEKELDSISKTDSVGYAMIKKVLTKEKVKSYVDTIFASEDIQKKLVDIYNTALKASNKAAIEEDNKLAAEAEAYENDEVESEPVPELDPNVATDKVDPINPPVDEVSETVASDDPTVEVLPQDKQNIFDEMDSEE